MPEGQFITLEGGEGAGKSSQISLLAEFLSKRDISVLTTREPGGAPGADVVRRLLVEGETDRWDPVSEALLHFAARRNHLVQTVWPALTAGTWVLSDRFADSTLAYQGYGHGLGRAPIEALYKLVAGDFAPVLTLILDLPANVGLGRAKGRSPSKETRYENMPLEFHKKLRMGFLQIAKDAPNRCVVVDATQSLSRVQSYIERIITDRFGL